MLSQFMLRRKIREYLAGERICLAQAREDQDSTSARAWLTIANNYREAIEHLQGDRGSHLPERLS